MHKLYLLFCKRILPRDVMKDLDGSTKPIYIRLRRTTKLAWRHMSFTASHITGKSTVC